MYKRKVKEYCEAKRKEVKIRVIAEIYCFMQKTITFSGKLLISALVYLINCQDRFAFAGYLFQYFGQRMNFLQYFFPVSASETISYCIYGSN